MRRVMKVLGGLAVVGAIAAIAILIGQSKLHQQLPTDMIVEENLPFLLSDLEEQLGSYERLGDFYVSWTSPLEVGGVTVMHKRLFAVTGIANGQAAIDEGLILGEEYVTSAGIHWDIGRVLLVNGIFYPDPPIYLYCATTDRIIPDCSLEFGNG